MVVASQLVARISTDGYDEANDKMRRMGQATDSTRDGLKSARATSEDFSDSLGGRLVGGLHSAISGFLDFGSQLGMTIFGFKQLAETAASTAMSLLGPAAAAEQVQGSLEVFTGSTEKAKKEMQELSEFSSHTPFEVEPIEQAALKLQSVGISAQDVIPDLTALGDGLDAVGRTSGADLSQLTDAFVKIKTEGHLTSETMGSFAAMGVDAWSVLEKQTGKTHEALQAMISAGLYPADDAMRDLTKGMEENPLYKGQMANDANVFNGVVSTLKSNWNQLLVGFGSPIIKALEPLLGNISSTLSSSGFQDFAGSIGQGIVNVFAKLGDAATYVGNVLKSLNLTDFHNAWKNIDVLLGSIEVHISRALSPALKTLKTDADPVAEVIGRLAKGGLDILSNILWNVEGALLAVDKELETGKGPITNFFGTFKSFLPDIQNIANLLMGQFKDGFKFASESAKQLGDWFKSSVAPALKDAMPGFIQLAHVMLQDVIPAIIQIRGVIMDVVEHALSKFGPILGQIIPPLIRFAGILAKDVAEGLKFIMPYVVSAAKELGKFADEIIDRVAPIVRDFIKGITPLIQGFMSWWTQNLPMISAIAKAVWDEVVGVVQIAWSLVSGIIKIGLDLIDGNWKQAWTDLLDMLGGIWEGIKQLVKGGIESAKVDLMYVEDVVDTYLVQPFRNALGQIGGIFGSIGKLIGDVTSANWGAIPGDAHALGFAGGTDFAPGGFAMVGEQGPEMMYVPRGAKVYSASQTSQMMSGGYAGSGGGQPIILVLDGHAVAHGLLPYQVQAIRNATGVRF